jgi:polysaccharide pyruvyl transferase WcaK-like protein
LKKHKKLLVNVISLYGKLVNGKVVPSESFRDERPELYETHGKMFSAYSTLVRQIVQDAIKDGFEVETIPFTNEDEAFGEIILKGLPVKLNRYHDDPYKMIKYMATATRIFATRYHTTIFSIKLGIPVYAVAYAYKNELLFDDLGVKRPYFISSTDLLTDDNPVLKPLMVDRKIIEDFELRSTLAIEASYEALNENI